MAAWRDIYTMSIYNYIKAHNNNTILLKDICEEFNITYPTVRTRIRKLIKMGKIKKTGRKFSILD